MKEIKVRVWDDIDKKMFVPHTQGNKKDVFYGLNETGLECSRYIGKGLWHRFDIMLFTGLRDKNGKDIYDGDILKQFPGFGCEWTDRIGVVKYEFASFWFEFKSQGQILDDHDCQFEVIGNIYENPDMIGDIQ